MFSPSDKVYMVTFIDEVNNVTTSLRIGSDECILDSALDQGVQLPASCYTGKCMTCACRLLKGEIEQHQVSLKPGEIAAGFILACKAYSRTDCVIVTHQEEALINWEDSC
jgi:ferredoxin